LPLEAAAPCEPSADAEACAPLEPERCALEWLVAWLAPCELCSPSVDAKVLLPLAPWLEPPAMRDVPLD
jgi:hypothetical protein